MSKLKEKTACKRIADNLYNIIDTYEKNPIIAPIVLSTIINYSEVCYMSCNNTQKEKIKKIKNACETNLGKPIVKKIIEKKPLTQVDEKIKVYETYKIVDKDIKQFLHQQSQEV